VDDIQRRFLFSGESMSTKRELFQFAAFVTAMGLIVIAAFTVLGLSCAARMGVNTDWYCTHLSNKDDTFCIVRELKK
jgi:hypothetical protein